MATINLLPKDISKESKASQRGQSLGVLAYTLFALGILTLVVGAGVVFMTQREVDNLREDQQALVAAVSDYQQEETQLVLVTDRLELINDVLLDNDLNNVREQQLVLYNNLLPGVRLFQQVISDAESSFTVQASGSMLLRQYIKQISQAEEFASLKVNRMTYSPSVGYQVELEVK